jgi:coproporphyrinogen III oxidase-like Fe-S oxidoreductase
MLGLRLLTAGVNRTAFQDRHGVALDSLFAEPIARMHSQGLLVDDGDAIRLTERGAMLANAVAAEFLPT